MTSDLTRTEFISPQIKASIDKFLDRFVSNNTKAAYRESLTGFFEFLLENGKACEQPSDVTERWIFLWAHSERSKFNKKPSSLARHLSALHSFFHFLKQEEVIARNPTDAVPRPKLSNVQLTPALTAEQAEQAILAVTRMLLRALRERGPQSRAYQAERLRYAVVGTLLMTGLRVSELCALKLQDFTIDRENEEDGEDPGATLQVSLKGKRRHTIVLNRDTQELLVRYIGECRKGASPEAPLFVRSAATREQTPLHRTSVFRMVRGLIPTILACPSSLSPHALRATLATLLHSQGVPLADIQELLGHQKIATTARYVRSQAELASDINPLKGLHIPK